MKLLEKVSWPKPGTYVLALSGGVDSVTLLDLLAKKGGYDLVVAHFNHGWGPTDEEYQAFAKKIAQKYNVPFHTVREVTPHNEATAREARYRFLHSVVKQTKSASLITAHQWDDRQETSIMNVLRGTNRYGLASLHSTEEICRPLLKVRKQELYSYAREHSLGWYEDYANDDAKFQRNVVRHHILKKTNEEDPEFDDWYIRVLEQADGLNQAIDEHMRSLFKEHVRTRTHEISLPLAVLRRLPLATLQNVLAAMVVHVDRGSHVGSRTFEELAVHLKTGRLKRLRKLNNRLNAATNSDRLTITAVRGKPEKAEK